VNLLRPIPQELRRSEAVRPSQARSGAHADRLGFRATVGRGTLFLDDERDLPPGAQAKLFLEPARVRSCPSAAIRAVDVDLAGSGPPNKESWAMARSGSFADWLGPRA